MSSRTTPEQFETVPRPPEATTGLRRLVRFLNGAAFGVVAVVGLLAGAQLSPAATPCVPQATPELVQEAIREIVRLQALEAEARRRRFGPGVIVPDLEDFR